MTAAAPAAGKHRVGRRLLAVLLLAVLTLLTAANLRLLRGAPAGPVHGPAAPDPAAWDPRSAPAPLDPADPAALLPGLPLDREPAGIALWPGATVLHRFTRSVPGGGEEVSVWRLPPDTDGRAVLAHCRDDAVDHGFEAAPAGQPDALTMHHADGRLLAARLHRTATGQPAHLTLWLRYASPESPEPRPTDPAGAARSPSP